MVNKSKMVGTIPEYVQMVEKQKETLEKVFRYLLGHHHNGLIFIHPYHWTTDEHISFKKFNVFGVAVVNAV